MGPWVNASSKILTFYRPNIETSTILKAGDTTMTPCFELVSSKTRCEAKGYEVICANIQNRYYLLSYQSELQKNNIVPWTPAEYVYMDKDIFESVGFCTILGVRVLPVSLCRTTPHFTRCKIIAPARLSLKHDGICAKDGGRKAENDGSDGTLTSSTSGARNKIW